jgi:hypothetical protein
MGLEALAAFRIFNFCRSLLAFCLSLQPHARIGTLGLLNLFLSEIPLGTVLSVRDFLRTGLGISTFRDLEVGGRFSILGLVALSRSMSIRGASRFGSNISGGGLFVRFRSTDVWKHVAYHNSHLGSIVSGNDCVQAGDDL